MVSIKDGARGGELPLRGGDGVLGVDQHGAVLTESEGGELGQGGGQEGDGERELLPPEDGEGDHTSSKLDTELDQRRDARQTQEKVKS